MKAPALKFAPVAFSALIMFVATVTANSQGTQTPSGRMWVYGRSGTSIQVIDRASGTELAVFNTSTNYQGPFCGGGQVGGGVAYDPNDGNIWITMLDNCGGDGWIHKIPAMGGADIRQYDFKPG